MNFIKGLLFGSLVGFSIGTALSERQRSELMARVRRRTTADVIGATSSSDPVQPATSR